MANKSLARCMGGSRCNHTPGKCTATNAEYQKAQIEARRPPATQAGDALVEELARIIASELGDDYDNAFSSKIGWVAARGESGGRYRDVNEPFKGDYDAAARAILPIIQRREAAAHAAGRAEERAKVVAWLRRCGVGRPTNSDDHIAAASAFTVSADAIERGQHKEPGDE